VSNALAIAAVTRTLRFVLERGMNTDSLSGVTITTRPLDKARGSNTGRQINLFLYQTSVSAAWRNAESPRASVPPALGLDLHYLVTAYGPDDDNNDDHILLGSAMRTLHDQIVLNRDYIQGALAGNDLYQQLERVRITPQPQSIEELSKLWGAFQTQYRVSAAFSVSVVLIDSRRSSRTPYPVLTRGKDDRGPTALTSALPTLRALEFPLGQPAARLGEAFTVLGTNLGAQNLKLHLEHPSLPQLVLDGLLAKPSIELQITDRADDHLEARLVGVGLDPNDLRLWPCGFWTLSAVTEPIADHPVSSNALALPLAPSIALDKTASPAGDIALTVTCRPRVRPGQRVTLLFGERQVALGTLTNPPDQTQGSQLEFTVPGVPASDLPYRVRLRVDGVDSLPVRTTGNPPRLEFDPEQQVLVGP
jgi:hypothetical protein